MGPDRALELALRIKADLNDASQDVAQFDSQVQKLGDDGKSAADGLKQTGKAVDDLAGKTKQASAAKDAFNAQGVSITPGLVGIGAGAVAFAAIALAIFQINEEVNNFDLALISTGNYLGTTSGQLIDVANRAGALTGRYGDAKEAALQLAQSGKVSAASIEAATVAAVDLAHLTGDSVESTVQLMIQLAEKPAEMLAKLNEQYHFLTPEVYDHVRALEEQGKMEDAARIAIEEFSQVHEQRVQQAKDSAWLLSKAWTAIGETISSVWNSIKNDMRTDVEHQLEVARANLQSIQNLDPRPSLEQQHWAEEVQRLEAIVAKEKERTQAQQVRQAANDKAIKDEQDRQNAQKDWDRLRISNLDKEQKLEAEIANIRKVGVAAGKSQADIDTQIAQARARYADSLPKGRTSTKKSDADIEEAAAKRDLENLTQQATLLDTLADGEKKVSEEARVRYEIEHGSYQQASAGTKQQLIDQAKLLDAKRQEREETQKTQQAYDRLRETLRTPAEVAVDKAKEQVDVLNAALEHGIGNASEYGANVGKAINAAFDKAPDFAGLSPEVGGVSSEQYRLDEAAKKLEDWRKDQLDRLNQFRSQQIGTEELWNAQQLRIDQETAEKRTQIQQAQNELIRAQVTNGFDSLLEAARNFAGEQAGIYQALFAISKGFAVAQAAVSLATNVAKASEAGYPANLVFIAGAFAQGAEILKLLSAAQYATGGSIYGPGTGTSDSIPIWASNGEFMVRQRSASQPGAEAFLNDFNSRGMAALQDWRGFADGGLISAASEPRYQIRDGGSGGASPSVNNKMRVYLLQNEDALAQRLAKHPAMEKAVVAYASQNGTAIRAEW